jgi:hypothetical protein
MKYAAHMKTAKWQGSRILVIRRCKGICERCHKWPVVNIHHLTYERVGNELPEDLLGVCSRCHRELHKEMDR